MTAPLPMLLIIMYRLLRELMKGCTMFCSGCFRKLVVIGVGVLAWPFFSVPCSAVADVESADSTLVSKITAEELAKMQIYQLEPFIVTATRTPKTLRNTPILSQVITRKQLETDAAVTVVEVLEDLPSIDFSPDSHGANIMMYGLGPRYVLFLVDGNRVSGETNGNIDFSRLNAVGIERVEVVKGALSALYGSNAIGGVVNIITRDVLAPLELDIVHSSSAYNELILSGALGLQKDGFTSRTEIVRKSSDGYDLNPCTASQTVEKYRDISVGQKFSVAPGRRFSFAGGLNYYESERYLASASLTHVHPKSYDETYQLAGVLKGDEFDRLKLAWHMDTYETRDVYELLDDIETTRYKHSKNTWSANTNWNAGEQQLFSAGIEYEHENLFSLRLLEEELAADLWGAYFQDDLDLGDDWNIVTGFRYDTHSDYGSHFSPKLSVMYRRERLKIRSGVGRGFRAPTLKELNMDWDHGGSGPFIYGDPDLQPEKSLQLNLSAELGAGPWSTSLTLFRNTLEGMIYVRQSGPEDDPPSEPNTYYYANTDEALLTGVEMLGAWSHASGFKITAGYVLLDTEDKKTGMELFERPRHSGRIRLSYRHKDWGAGFSLRGRIVGSKLYYAGEDAETGEILTDSQKAHNLWDLDVNKDLFGAITLNVGVRNLFDYTDKAFLQTPGCTIRAGVRLHLRKEPRS